MACGQKDACRGQVRILAVAHEIRRLSNDIRANPTQLNECIGKLSTVERGAHVRNANFSAKWISSWLPEPVKPKRGAVKEEIQRHDHS